MMTLDLLELIGVIACSMNHKVKVKDLDKFNDWLHVIYDIVVIKIYVGNNDVEKKVTKFDAVYIRWLEIY